MVGEIPQKCLRNAINTYINVKPLLKDNSEKEKGLKLDNTIGLIINKEIIML